MKKFAWLFGLALLFGLDAAIVQAQQMLPQIAFSRPHGYVGPGNVVSGASIAYSCSRAYSAATAGTKACNVCNAANSSCADVLSNATTGIVPVPKPDGVTSCNNTTNICTVATAYDQSGNGVDLTAGTVAKQPLLVVANGSLGSALVYMQFFLQDASQLLTASTPSSGNPTTFVMYSQRNANFTTTGTVLSMSNFKARYANSANSFAFGNNTLFNATVSDSAWHSIIGVGNNTASFITVDGVAGGNNSTTNSATTGAGLGTESPSAANTLTGVVAEAIDYPNKAFGSSQYGPMNANQQAFYGNGAAAPYTGPGDYTPTAAAWVGLRAYSAATRGTAAVNVCNSTGGVDVGCGDLSTDATTGKLVAATISGITCPGANCTVKEWYDQSGNSCNFTQATVANRYTLAASIFGSDPAAQHSSTSQFYISFCTVNQTQPFAAAAYIERTANFTSNGFVYGNTLSSNSANMGFANTTNNTSVGTSVGLGGAATDSVAHAEIGQFGTTTSNSNNVIDGTYHTGNAGTTTSGTQNICLGARGTSCTGTTGGATFYMAEVGLWLTTFSDAQIFYLNLNLTTYH